LCLAHGARRVRLITTYNLLFGNLGFGVFASPVISFRNIRGARALGAIGPLEAGIWFAFTF